MPIIAEERLRSLLQPYLKGQGARDGVPEAMYAQLSTYLELLVRWNGKTNLTAVRDPEEMVCRHFGESLFAGSVLGDVVEGEVEVLDLGSGAGFPGLPMQLLHPEWKVTLGESQGKKAAFLREVVRQLGLQTEVWAGRVEALPASRRFGAVVMRAVDRMEAMEAVGRGRLAAEGVLLRMVAGRSEGWRGERIPGTVESYVEMKVGE